MKELINQLIHCDGAPPSGLLGDIENIRVVAFRISEDGNSILVGECCDGFFAVELSVEEFDTMLRELNELRGRLSPGERSASNAHGMSVRSAADHGGSPDPSGQAGARS